MSEFHPSEKAMNYAVKFYEADNELNSGDRVELSQRLRNASMRSLAISWSGFFVGFGVPLYINFKKTGKLKGNFQLPIIGGMGMMAFVTHFGTKYAYANGLQKAQEGGNPRVVRVFEAVKSPEMSRWWMYYDLTSKDSSKIMKDPRSMDLVKGRFGVIHEKDAEEKQHEESGENSQYSSQYKFPENKQFGENKYSVDPLDELTEPAREPPVINSGSSWDRLRQENGISSGSSGSWGRLRNSEPRQGFSSARAEPISKEQESFDELLERERSIGESEKDKW